MVGILPKSFYETCVTLIQKLDADKTKKKIIYPKYLLTVVRIARKEVNNLKKEIENIRR
jgi:hypothetical protein